MDWLKKRTLQLNLFETKLSWTDMERRQTEIITTRLFLILLSVCIVMVSIYTSSTFQIQVFTVENPTEAIFGELNMNTLYAPTLDCPCRDLTIAYNRFIQIPVRFHQICSSDFFISNYQWLKLFSSFTLEGSYAFHDYRLFVVPQFRALASLCKVANKTVTDAFSAFLSDSMITKQAESVVVVKSRVNWTVVQFESSTIEAFIVNFNHVRDMVKNNRVVSSTRSDWYLPDIPSSVGRVLYLLPRSYGNGTCSCDRDPTCSAPAFINQQLIPGFRVGCSPIESFLESTLECLYNISCIEQLTPNVTGSASLFRALDPALSSPAATVQTLVDTLMIDEWTLTISYDSYYAACAPRYCSYSLTRRFDLVYVFTSILGLSGGLTVVLKLLLPPAVKLGRYIARYCSRVVSPAVATITEAT